MNVQILSDLHLEFARDKGASFVRELDSTGVDLLLLAGDICDCDSIPLVLPEIAKQYAPTPCVFVPGNHEYYGASWQEVHDAMDEADAKASNLHLLLHDKIEVHGRKVLGTTLWFPQFAENSRYEELLNDFRMIEGLKPRVYEENAQARRFLEQEIEPGAIVVTHHLPSLRSVPLQYLGSELNRFFVCQLDPLVERAALWCHGHTHDSVRWTADSGTVVVANPFGYPTLAENPDFEPQLLVKL